MVITADIGSVMVDDGRIRAGFSQTAGQIAHLSVSDSHTPCPCGKTGCLSVMASDDAVAAATKRRGIEGVANIDDVLELANGGNEVAIEILEQRNRYVGRAASQLIDIHDPELLVVAGTPAETPGYLGSMISGWPGPPMRGQVLPDAWCCPRTTFFPFRCLPLPRWLMRSSPTRWDMWFPESIGT